VKAVITRLAGLATALLVAGCAQLPTELSVQSGPALEASGTQDFVYYSPSGPVAGSSPEEIVSGFLNAGTGPQNDYSIARQFLSNDFAPRWQPELRVLVRSSVPVLQYDSPESIPVRLLVTAEVDEYGEFRDAENVEELLEFALVQERGEWRIASAPNLTVVTQPVFDVVFQAYALYFLNPSLSKLVPDLRWFPTRASTPTRLVNALLAGPSEWLAPGVKSAIPVETRLTVDAVRVVDGTALVDFDASLLGASATARSLMLEQLRATLTQLVSVQSVSILVSSNPQEIVPVLVPKPSGAFSAFLMTDAGVYRIIGSNTEALPGTATAIIRSDAERFSISPDLEVLALGSERGAFRAAPGVNTIIDLIDERPDLLPPQLDSDGSIWVLPRNTADELRIYGAGSAMRTISIEGEVVERIAAALSPDGTRLAEVILSNGNQRVMISAVIRDSLGVARALGPRMPLPAPVGEPIALAWSDASTLVGLEELVSGNTLVVRYPILGPREQLTNPPVTGVQIAAAGGGAVIYLLSETGDVWALTGSSWRVIYRDAVALGATVQ